MRRACALALALCVATGEAQADDPVPSPDPDPWFGPDKALHFGAGFTVSAAGYGIGVAAFERRWAAALLGGGSALGLAGLKEGLDAAGLGDPSWRDFLWSAVGTALGLGVAVTFDAALRGVEPL